MSKQVKAMKKAPAKAPAKKAPSVKAAKKAPTAQADDTKRTARNKVIVQRLSNQEGTEAILVVYDRKGRHMGWVEGVGGKFPFLTGRTAIQMVPTTVARLDVHRTGQHIENTAANS